MTDNDGNCPEEIEMHSISTRSHAPCVDSFKKSEETLSKPPISHKDDRAVGWRRRRRRQRQASKRPVDPYGTVTCKARFYSAGDFVNGNIIPLFPSDERDLELHWKQRAKQGIFAIRTIEP